MAQIRVDGGGVAPNVNDATTKGSNNAPVDQRDIAHRQAKVVDSMRSKGIQETANGHSPYAGGKKYQVQKGDTISQLAERALLIELRGGNKPTRAQVEKATALIIEKNRTLLEEALKSYPEAGPYQTRPFGDFIKEGMNLEMPNLWADVLLEGEKMKVRNGRLVPEKPAVGTADVDKLLTKMAGNELLTREEAYAFNQALNSGKVAQVMQQRGGGDEMARKLLQKVKAGQALSSNEQGLLEAVQSSGAFARVLDGFPSSAQEMAKADALLKKIAYNETLSFEEAEAFRQALNSGAVAQTLKQRGTGDESARILLQKVNSNETLAHNELMMLRAAQSTGAFARVLQTQNTGIPA